MFHSFPEAGFSSCAPLCTVWPGEAHLSGSGARCGPIRYAVEFRSHACMEPAPELEVSPVSLASYVRLLRGNGNFRRLWGAQVVSEIGDWFYTLAIYNLLLQLTGHASSVALALVLQVLPQTLIGPAAGVINDRISRKRVMIAADLVRAVVVVSMLLVR